jgi:folate-binding protein YgfZ
MTEGYEALRNGAAWIDLSSRVRITARGRDRVRFMHNITSNDVKSMTPGSSCYAFLLTPQGRIQADLYLVAYEEHFLIDTEPELSEKVLQHLRKYKVADQVEFEDVTETTASFGVEGPGAAGLKIHDAQAEGISYTGQPGFRIYCADAEKAAVIARLESAGVHTASPEDAAVVRIENGRPLYGIDITDTTLPQETQQLQALSFTKGCYIGQEIVERIRARGHVNRLLERIELDTTDAPAPGTIVTWNGREAQVTSTVYSPGLGKVVGLAYVRVG